MSDLLQTGSNGRQFATRRLVLGGAAAMALAAASPAVARRSGRGRSGAFRLDRHQRVWTYEPPGADPQTPILIVLHGQGRNAEDYRDSWIDHADRHGAIILAPEFSEGVFTGARNYNQGGVLDLDGDLRPGGDWAFARVERAFDAYVRAAGSRRSAYSLYGHSAGAQFVHRFLLFTPNARVDRAVAANAGWYTMPDTRQDYPYGVAGVPVGDDQLRRFVEAPLTILLGGADDDPDDGALLRTPGALRQGPHRFARGERFYDAGRKAAARLNAPFGWRLQVAPGVAHTNEKMSVVAAQLLLG